MLPLRDRLPTRTFPFVNYALIAANLGVFTLEWLGGGEALVQQLGVIPAELLADPLSNAPRLLTHMFVHASWSHVLGNMLFLWIFGDNVEDALGHLRYVGFYLACGLVAAIAQIAFSAGSEMPLVGASGAIAGVLAAYAIFYPRSPIVVLNPIPLLWLFWGLTFDLPAWVVIALFFVVNLMNAFQAASAAGATGGVAFMAHVGGFVAGLVLQRVMRKDPHAEYDPWDRFVTRRR